MNSITPLTQEQFFKIITSLDEENPFKNGIHTLSILNVDKQNDATTFLETVAEIDYKKIGMNNILILNHKPHTLTYHFKLDDSHMIISVFSTGVYGYANALKIKNIHDIKHLDVQLDRHLSLYCEFKNDLEPLFIMDEKDDLENKVVLPNEMLGNNKKLKV